MGSVGVGLIGTGFMGKCHALAWNSVTPVFGDCSKPRLVCLAEVSPELAKERADEFGFERWTPNWRSLIEDPEIDVVSITTPNQFHAAMAIAALEAGKHVWCEKPMATVLADAGKMLDAARESGKMAILGYNYIQNPAIREIRSLLADGAIGQVNHLRIEMDEDFMAAPEALFYWKHESSSGYGALDDFAVHPLSILWTLFGPVRSVMTDMAKPYPDRQTAEGKRRTVETYDVASVLMRLDAGITGTLHVNRSAWGRKGRIALQVFGSKGSILYDQERMNEYQLYQASDPVAVQGYRTVLTGPQHYPYGRFVPAPGHSLGFNDLKIIECHELLKAIGGEDAHIISFEEGVAIERTVHAMARSFVEERWVATDAG
ncbi:MAG: Gfo/Idh/MocA family protein [Phyllobacterium sp.]